MRAFMRKFAAHGRGRQHLEEKFQAFCEEILFSGGAGNVALRPEREDRRILEKISPFAWCRECGVAAGKRRLQDFEEEFSFPVLPDWRLSSGKEKISKMCRKSYKNVL